MKTKKTSPKMRRAKHVKRARTLLDWLGAYEGFGPSDHDEVYHIVKELNTVLQEIGKLNYRIGDE